MRLSHNPMDARGYRANPATWEAVKALIVQLDCYLTGRRDPFMRQAYANTVDPVDFAEGAEWYLGDGGYSRMRLKRDGALVLTSNSIPRTRAKWDDPEARRLRKAIQEGMRELYGSELETNPGKPRVVSSGLAVIEHFDGQFHIMLPTGAVWMRPTARQAEAFAKKWAKKTHMQKDAVNVLRIDWRGEAAGLARKAGITSEGRG